MTTERLSRLQHRILAWLMAEDQCTRGTMAASHQDLVRAMVAGGLDKGNVGPASRAWRRRAWCDRKTPGGQAEAVDLTAEGENGSSLTASCE